MTRNNILHVYRFDDYNQRSVDMEIEASTIESVAKVWDSRHVTAIVRTKSGDIIYVTDDYQTLVMRWKEKCQS